MNDEREYLKKIDDATNRGTVIDSVALAILGGCRAIAYAIVFLGRCYISK